MLTQHGPRCDVCGEYILVTPGEFFRLGGIEEELCGHAKPYKCMDVMRAASAANDVLPDGPIRRAYQQLADTEGARNAQQ